MSSRIPSVASGFSLGLSASLSLGIVLGICLGAAPTPALAQQSVTTELVYVGTRDTSEKPAAGQGIYAVRLDARSGKLTSLGRQAELNVVSWLVPNSDHSVMFAVTSPGGRYAESWLYSYAVDKASGQLRLTRNVGSSAWDTTHLAFDSRSNTLFGGAFGSGEVTAYQVLSDGTLGKLASKQKHTGSGPAPRQTEPHAHAVAVDPTGRYVVSSDMGADRVFVHPFDAKTRELSAGDPPFVQSAPGSGPRHLVFHPNGRFVYVNTELSAEVLVYAWDAQRGRLPLIETLSAYPAGYSGADRSSSEIGIDRSGRHLYVTLRGDQNSIVVYDVDVRSGRLKEKQRVASQGKSPRSFGIDSTGRWMLVVNDVSNSVNVFAIDAKSGELKATGESLSIPGAGCLTFL